MRKFLIVLATIGACTKANEPSKPATVTDAVPEAADAPAAATAADAPSETTAAK